MGRTALCRPMDDLCPRCDTLLIPGFDGRLRCPLFGGCGTAGGFEQGGRRSRRRARAARPIAEVGIAQWRTANTRPEKARL